MTTQQQWDTSESINDLVGATAEDTDDLNDLFLPPWIESTISPYQVQSIIKGGCEGGAYLPAVVYHQAQEIMHDHGDHVLDYIESIRGDLPAPMAGSSWAGIATHYLSTAVELWAHSTAEALEGIDIKGDN